MDWVLHESMRGHDSLPPIPPPPPLDHSSLGSKISPSVLLIIVILAAIFFISGLLHLLVRCLLKPTTREPDDTGSATALQGQLQQLFHLHDSGVDQLFIDALPVFLYKAIIGLKDPFDCAVCLCEFEPDDKLRLLPKCSHAFHIDCIDTWLLSHSTCPLCRRSLIPDFSPGCSPLVLVLESGSESSIEFAADGADPAPPDDSHEPVEVEVEAQVVPVKLGKFRGMESNASQAGDDGSSNSNANLDQRRCFSLGAYEYVLDETLLQVAIKPSKNQPRAKKSRLAMSEWDCQSRREGFRGFFQSSDNARVTLKKDSFSVSKIWMQSKKERAGNEDCSRRAFSFRLPVNLGSSRRSAASEFVVARWEKSGSEIEVDVEAVSCNNSIGSLAEEAPSFTRRTLLWIMGRQSKVGSHS